MAMMLHDGQSIMIPKELDAERKPTEAFLDSLIASATDPTGGGSATDRSSASPSNADDLMEDDGNNGHKEDLEEDDDDEEEEEEEEIETNNNRDHRRNIAHRMTGMENQFMYLQHQLARIMRQLHVTPCACESCSSLHQTISGVRQLNDPTQMLSQLFPNASSQQLETLLELSKMNKLPSQVVSQKEHHHQNPVQTTSTAQSLAEVAVTQIPVSTTATSHVATPVVSSSSNSSSTPVLNANPISVSSSQPRLSSRSPPAVSAAAIAKLGTGYSTNQSVGGGKMPVERGASESRKAIVEFAKSHGGAAAAKKFGFPPPVATYYQRKDSSHSLVPTPLASIPQQTPTPSVNYPTSLPSAQPPNSATASPGPSSDGGDRDDNPDTPQFNESSANSISGGQSMPTTPSIGNPPIFTQSMVDMLKMNANAAHSTGSPGFLRGRGRGRPKLIGDELDADLVDYMVQVKQTDPHGHLTASQALHIAKQYILERAPGLLEEHGGHVKLKLTWAMKLVSRIAERQKEMEYGLPAGTLSNMGRNLGTLPGGNFMADVMAQNIFSQHMMMVNQVATGYGSGEAKSANQETTKKSEVIPKQETLHNNEENVANAASISDIVNIKDLNLPFLNNFLAELNGKSTALAADGEVANQLSIQDTEMRNV